MTNPKWEIGPVRLMDGSEGHVYFVQPESKHQRYIGKAKESNGQWRALHWCDAGRVPYATTGYEKNLAPPPKKTVRVKVWINVNPKSYVVYYTRDMADKNAQLNRIACKEIDIEVTEGEGL